jgi:hypothetical protein
MDLRTRAPWRPLLEGEAAAPALQAIEEIAAALVDAREVVEPSLADGAAGRALLYGYLADAWPERGWGDVAERCLERAIDLLAEKPMREFLYGGFTGVAWTAEHLQGRFAGPDDEDASESIDLALVDYLATTPWRGEYDLISGLTGLGLYALERLPRASAAECLGHIVDRLDEAAERVTDGIRWLTRPELMIPETRAQFPEGYYNLGVAHGVPGVVAMLGATCAAGVAPKKARPLLDGAVAWMLAQRIPDGPAALPYWTAAGRPPDPARSAWCYGDPGACAALLWAARAVDEPAWELAALEIAHRAAARPQDTCGVVDAGLCHGAAGLLHIFNRLYRATGDPALGDAARRWLARTLELRQPGSGVAGYRSFSPGPDRKLAWSDDNGFLTGVIGIALALLGAVAPVEPAWDRLLATSVPPR